MYIHAAVVFILNLSWSVALANESLGGTFSLSEWKAAEDKAQQFISNLALEEKFVLVRGNGSAGGCIGNIQGIDRVAFPGICFSDGPQAVARNAWVSAFPSGVSAGATWDSELVYQRGVALGTEFRGKGAHVYLGPVAGPLGRHADGGRNWEGFAADPYLSGVFMANTIKGVQSTGVQACPKHFIGNEQENHRSNTPVLNGTEIDAISANIGDRTLHELYLWPFADAVKAGAASVMCAYNRLNQTYSCEHSNLLSGVLRKELGFRGYVVSDWGALHSDVKAANAGLDLDMPGVLPGNANANLPTYFDKLLQGHIKDGSFSIERLDEMARRIMTPFFLLHQDSPEFPTQDPTMKIMLGIAQLGLAPSREMNISMGQPWIEIEPRDVRADHAQLIRTIGAAGTVLLKNHNSTLPLQKPKNIGVFGAAAADFYNGMSYPSVNAPPELSTLPIGGGSGTAVMTDLVPPLEALKLKARESGAKIQYILNDTAIANNEIRFYPTPEVCIVLVSAFASESYDRPSLLAERNSSAVVQNIAQICPNTVVVVNGPGVVTIPWAEHPNVTAILHVHFPGEQIGNSLVDVLWGIQEPSGRLPYTIPMNEVDGVIPTVTEPRGNGPADWQADFVEGQYIDYRLFDKQNITPRYEFGYGLGYSEFQLEGLEIERKSQNLTAGSISTQDIEPGGDPALWVEILDVQTRLSNIGKVAGSEVAQLYVSFPDSAPVDTPVRVLRGFSKVRLEPGESFDVRFALTRRDVSYWDTVSQQWLIPSGTFTFHVGFSSRNLKETATLDILSPASRRRGLKPGESVIIKYSK